jgi:hypothetical protein
MADITPGSECLEPRSIATLRVVVSEARDAGATRKGPHDAAEVQLHKLVPSSSPKNTRGAVQEVRKTLLAVQILPDASKLVPRNALVALSSLS